MKNEYRVMAIGALGYPYGCGYQGFDKDEANADMQRLIEQRPDRHYIIQVRQVGEWA